MCCFQKEQCEQNRRKLSHVTRQLTQERSDKEGLEDQTSEIEDLYKQLTEQNKIIAALKQTCSVSCILILIIICAAYSISVCKPLSEYGITVSHGYLL